jgi:acetylornithine deacetylase
MQPTCCAELSPAERREFEERRLIGLVVVPGAEVPFRADYWRWRRRGDAGRHPGRDEDDQAEQQPTKIERKFESRVDRESREPVFEALHGYDERIDVLPDRDTWRSRLLNYVDEHSTEIVTDLSGLVQIPSVSGSDKEIEIQHLISDRMITMDLAVDTWQIPLEETLAEPDFPGVEVDRSEAWGVVGRVAGRGNGPSLMLNAHVDVVPPGDPLSWEGADPFSGRVTGDTVEGRGACDMKAGLVASLWAVRGLTELKVPLRGDLVLATVVGEEDGGLGTYALLRRGWRADACVIPEPTSLDIAPASAGALTFRITVPGAATHASRRLSGVSAIEKFIPLFSALRRLERERNVIKHSLATRWELPIPIEIGKIAAGDWVSNVPDRLYAYGRMGVAIGEDIPTARRAFEEAIGAACQDDVWLRVHPATVEWWGGQYASGITDVDSAIISTVQRCHADVSKSPQTMWATPYGSDLRLMQGIGTVPTIHYGPGDAGLAHGPRECVSIDELLTATRALTLIAIDHCGLS